MYVCIYIYKISGSWLKNGGRVIVMCGFCGG